MTARSRNARSCDTATTAAGVDATNALEQVEAGEVEVVGGLVEQEHVVPGEQHGGQRRPGRLAAGEVGHLELDPIGRQPHLREHRTGARLEIVATEGEEAVERLAVGLDRGVVVAERNRRRVERGRCRRHTGAAGEVVAQALARHRVALLGQPADGGGGRRPLDRAAVRHLESRQDAQQRRLADAVRPDDAEARAGRDGHADVLEDDLRAVVAADLTGDEHEVRRYRRGSANP